MKFKPKEGKLRATEVLQKYYYQKSEEMTQKEFAKKLSDFSSEPISESAVKNWINENESIPPKHYDVIAKVCECDIEYLFYQTDIKNNAARQKQIDELKTRKKKYIAEIKEIEEKLKQLKDSEEKINSSTLIKDNAIKGLKELENSLESSMSYIEDIKLNEEYYDIVSSMISDVNLWLTLIFEAERYISTKTNFNQLEKFYNYHNRNIDIDVEYPTAIEPEEITKYIICKPFIKHFFEYIDSKSKNILTKEDFEEQEVTEIKKFFSNIKTEKICEESKKKQKKKSQKRKSKRNNSTSGKSN